MSSAVRQTPFTEIESPWFVPSVTTRALITSRAFSPRSSMLRTLPSSSIMPVNISHHLCKYLVDILACRVDHDSVISNFQRRVSAGRVTTVTLDHVRKRLRVRRGRERSYVIFFITTLGAFLGRGGE